MKPSLIIFLLVAFAGQHLFAQDSVLLKKRVFRIIATDFDKTITKGFLVNITDSAIQVTNQPVQFARTQTEQVNITTLNYNLLTAVRIKRTNGGLRGLGIGFVCGFAIGGIIGLASGDDKTGFFRLTAGEKALSGGLVAGILSAGIGAIIGALPGRKFMIGGKKENFDQLRFSVLDRAYRNN